MLFSSAFENYRNNNEKVQRWVDLLTKAVKDCGKKVLVDCGCGVGRFTIPLSELFMTTYGVDNDISMIEIAHSKKSNVHWINADVTKIPLESNSIDVILASMLIEHLESLDSFLEEAHRLLKKGGILLLRTMLWDDIDRTTWYGFLEKVCLMEKKRTPDIEQLLKAFGSFQFIWSQNDSFVHITEKIPNSNLVDRLEAKSYEILHHISERDFRDLIHNAKSWETESDCEEIMSSSLLSFIRE